MSESRESGVVDRETSERGGVSPLALGRQPAGKNRGAYAAPLGMVSLGEAAAQCNRNEIEAAKPDFGLHL